LGVQSEMSDMKGLTDLRIAAIIYMVLGVYALVFPIVYDISLYPLYIVGGLSILCGAGVLLLKKWAVWISAALFPVMLMLSIATLYYSVSVAGFYPDWERMLFHLSLVIYLILSIVGFLLVIDKRKDLK
jgi:hypothetical protein